MTNEYQFGDIIFIRVDNFLYRRVAESSGSWTSHVGILYEHSEAGWVVAESRVPRCGYCPIDKFIARSRNGEYSVKRLNRSLTENECEAMKVAIHERMGLFYHLGFNYDSKRQFCSKFVYEVYKEGTGLEIGHLETFKELLSNKPDYPLWFWKLWYFGRIPWARRTVSPGSQYTSKLLETVSEKR
ncbi:YiiX/YebB-like N1pC/P60 family cysteine hydrolase [Rubellicoccus peritrichatus]|uniref:YiiX/YebB-like N1pC/P60 family cysteine hydrolase n=1 Tax=Rubellicoccus peritrichatus TaxID=3080537 RepID=A0AAQ3LCH8_9BACT|nr:YiiX/YebB-like N1pC/P60 family cysteine hydrolase [Puniceicoccus sp. CR14]WOO43559.1 YiiX/YebB-like N1pC/P60 family cysteine hydrolase [Puniceicoccus sp. CR14]